jgi:hypothetical protein
MVYGSCDRSLGAKAKIAMSAVKASDLISLSLHSPAQTPKAPAFLLFQAHRVHNLMDAIVVSERQPRV